MAFGVIVMGSIGYIAAFVPETHKRTLEEIEDQFIAQRAAARSRLFYFRFSSPFCSYWKCPTKVRRPPRCLTIVVWLRATELGARCCY